ncbi:MAG: GGDEF domain-containing protein, partial [Bacilli bacterium]|nr:GGDEF domain-containing protein [Bacilli bacterium]
TNKVVYYVFNEQKELKEVKEDRGWLRTYNDYCQTLYPEDRQYFYEMTKYGYFNELKEGENINVVFRSNILGNGYVWYQGLITMRMVKNDNHDPELSAIVLISDITNQINEQERLKNKSERDSLTGLYNRTSMDEIIHQWQSLEASCSVIFMDVNGLKYTNDTYGHEEGDKLLKGVSKYMDILHRYGYEIYRYGGDEFIALGEYHPLEDIKRYMDEYLSLLEKNNLKDRIAYGIVNDKKKKDISYILHEADEKMYEMKKAMKATRKG